MVANIAHRGARSLAPENTIAAAEKAFQVGADLWETDVSVTRDEVLILFHDRYLTRTTNVAQVFPGRPSDPVVDYLFSEIQMLDTGLPYIASDPFQQIRQNNVSRSDLHAYRGEKVPSLEQALVYTKEKQWTVNLEVKVQPGRFKRFPLFRRVLDVVDYVGIDPGQVIISSFNHAWLEQVKTTAPWMSIQALIGENRFRSMKWGDFSFSAYNANSELVDEAQIRRAKGRGKRVNLFTVNDTADMVRFINAGVDGFITDYSQRLAALLKDPSICR